MSNPDNIEARSEITYPHHKTILEAIQSINPKLEKIFSALLTYRELALAQQEAKEDKQADTSGAKQPARRDFIMFTNDPQDLQELPLPPALKIVQVLQACGISVKDSNIDPDAIDMSVFSLEGWESKDIITRIFDHNKVVQHSPYETYNTYHGSKVWKRKAPDGSWNYFGIQTGINGPTHPKKRIDFSFWNVPASASETNPLDSTAFPHMSLSIEGESSKVQQNTTLVTVGFTDTKQIQYPNLQETMGVHFLKVQTRYPTQEVLWIS